MSATAETYLRLLSRMKKQRTEVEPVWVKCFDVTFPERGNGLQGSSIDPQGVQAKQAECLDGTAAEAAAQQASEISSGMTPANAVWAYLDVGDESDEERRWLDHAARVMWEKIHGANYDSEKYEVNLDIVIAGIAALFVDRGKLHGSLRFEQWPLAQCYVANSESGGPVDTIARCHSMTAIQALNEFGADKVDEKVRECAQGDKQDEKFEYVHFIRPRADAIQGSLLAKHLPFESIYVEVHSKRIVRESGYHEFPVAVPRMRRLPGSPYALGIVAQALPTIRELNELLALEKQALARAAAGVYVATDDGVLNPRAVKVVGGSVIVANSIDSIAPLASGADFNVTFSKADQMRAEIRKLMMADQLQPQDGPAMTATEVHVRVALIRQLRGPLYGRLQNDDLGPTITRVFGLLYRAGRPELGGDPGPVVIDDAPESLAGVEFNVRYQGPLARAQRLEEVTAIERTAGFVNALVAGGVAEAGDLLDTDEAIRLYGDGIGAPDKVIRDLKAVAQRRQAREQVQAEQAQQAQAQQIQTMAADAAFKRAAAPQ